MPNCWKSHISTILSWAGLSVLQGKFAKYKKYMGHSAHVTNIRFSSGDKKLVTTGGADTALMVFDHIVPAGRITQCGDSDDSDIDSEEEGGKWYHCRIITQCADSYASGIDSEEEGGK